MAIMAGNAWTKKMRRDADTARDAAIEFDLAFVPLTEDGFVAMHGFHIDLPPEPISDNNDK